MDRKQLIDNLESSLNKSTREIVDAPVSSFTDDSIVMNIIREDGKKKYSGKSELEMSTILITLELKIEELTRENEYLRSKLNL